MEINEMSQFFPRAGNCEKCMLLCGDCGSCMIYGYGSKDMRKQCAEEWGGEADGQKNIETVPGAEEGTVTD